MIGTMTTTMMSRSRRLITALFFVGCCLIISFSGVSTQARSSPICDIPEGEFDGMFLDSYYDEPLYGDRCKGELSFHQIRVYRCLFKYCCSPPCDCSNASSSNTCPSNAVAMSCFVLNEEPENNRYQCCNGSVSDRFHVCTKQINCQLPTDNGCGLGQVCLHNNTSGFDYCDCPPGFNMTVVDSNGTKVCKDINECSSNRSKCIDICVNTNGSYNCSCEKNRTLSSDGYQCIDPPLPVVVRTTLIPVLSSSTGFQYSYIALLLLLLLLPLLLLLLFLLCRRRRKRRAAAYSNDAYGVGVEVEKVAKDGVFIIGKKKSSPGSTNGRPENEYVDQPTKGDGRKASYQRQTSSSSTSSTHPLFSQTLSSHPMYAYPLSTPPLYSQPLTYQQLASLQLQANQYEELDAARMSPAAADNSDGPTDSYGHFGPSGPLYPTGPADTTGLVGADGATGHVHEAIQKPAHEQTPVKPISFTSIPSMGEFQTPGGVEMKPASVVQNQYTELPGPVATSVTPSPSAGDEHLPGVGYGYVDEGGYAEIK